MKPVKTINIVDKLTSESYASIEQLLDIEIKAIYLYKSKPGAYLNMSMSRATHTCDSMLIAKFDIVKRIAQKFLLTQVFKNKDTWSSYSLINVEKTEDDDFDINSLYAKDTFSFQLPKGISFISADIYGVLCKDHILDYDEDFPESKTLISKNSDCMIRLNMKNGKFIVCWGKEGLMHFSYGFTDEEFNNYLENTRRGWGEDQGYVYKYSIRK